MPSLLSYRFEQLIHQDTTAHNQQPCRLLAIHLYVDELEKESEFYANLLSCSPLVEGTKSVSFLLADGISLVLNKLNPNEVEGKKDQYIRSGQVELELETAELSGIRSRLSASLKKGLHWLSFEKQHLLKIFSPTGLLLSFRQKILE